jgi:hypothetical protein
MATTLSRTGLVLPAGSEAADVSIPNANMTKIDGWVGVFFCTSSTRPSTPFTGQLIFETDTRLFSMYDGSAWIQFLAAGGATVHEAEYYASGTQSIPSGADTPLGFNTAITTTTDVTVGTSTGGSIANAKFTLNRTGLWLVVANCRLTSASGQSCGIWLGLDNASTPRICENMESSGGTANGAYNLAAFRRMGSGTNLNVYCWQNSGSAKSTDVSGQATKIQLAWLRP